MRETANTLPKIKEKKRAGRPKSKHSFKLVEGEYSVEQANDILFNLVNSKINFHNLEIFSLKERFDTDNAHSEKRLEELKMVNKGLKLLLQDAKEKGLRLSVKSNIEIEFIKE